MILCIPKLTIRDLFWLMLLAAVAIGWWLERSRALKQIGELRAQFPWLAVPTQKSTGWFKRNQLLVELRGLSQQQLLERFAKEEAPSPYLARDEYCCCLIEMARRGMQAELQIAYDRLQQTAPMPPHANAANAYLLTALRRAQGKPDPLQVDLDVETVTATDQNPPKQIPQIYVALINRDSEIVNVTRGGDYRSGRQTRWRVELTNEQGVRILDSNFPAFGMGGGISSFGPLQPGEVLDSYNPLDARCYVKSPPSGRYQLQVIYAEQEIATVPDVDGLIVWKSKPITVQIENQTGSHEQRFSTVPLISILVVGFIAFWILQLRRTSVVTDVEHSARPLWNGRDLVALVCIIGLTIGWIVETRSLRATIDAMRPDRDANWSIKVIQH